MSTGKRMTPAQAWTLALVSVASFMISLDSLVVTTALTAIRLDLDASIEALEWTVNAYNLSLAVLLLTGAALGDRLGRRRMFVVGLAVFTAASVACALSASVGWLIAARGVQGAGAALVLPLALAQLSAAFPPAQRGRALGLFMGVTGLATFSGPFIGGAVTEGLAWEWIFWINLPIGVLVVLLVLARMTEGFGPDSRLDLAGVVLATGSWSRPGMGAGARQRRRVGQHRGRGVAGCRRGPRRRLHRMGTTHQHADAAGAVLPRASVHHGEHSHLLPVRLPVPHPVLPRSVPADRAGPWAARSRTPAQAVDRHADDLCPDRGRAGRPVW